MTEAASDVRSQAGDPQASPRYLLPTLVFTCTVIAMVSSLGAPLIKTISLTNHVSISTGEWVLTAALLTGAVATPVLGRLADGAHQRRVVLVTLGVAAVGCVLSAVSNDFLLLVVGRALQGVSLGLMPVTMAIARRTLDPASANRGIATLSVSNAIGVGLGYPVTGIIVTFASYHAAYWFGAFVVLMALLAAALFLPGASKVTSKPFDVSGAVALGLAVTGVSVVLTEGGSWGWSSPITLGIWAAVAVLLILWVRRELRFAYPLVDLRHLRNRAVLAADVAGMVMSIAIYLVLPVMVTFTQVPASYGFGFGATSFVAGLALVPLSVGTFIASRLLGGFERRFGTRNMVPLGALLFAAAPLLFALEHGALWEVFVALGITGLGIGFSFGAMPGFIVRAVPHRETGSAMGFYQVLRNVGLSIGSAVAAAILLTFTHPGQPFPSEAGFQVALFTAVALSLLAAVLSYVLPGKAQASLEDLDEGERRAVLELMEEESELAGSSAMRTDAHEFDDERSEAP